MPQLPAKYEEEWEVGETSLRLYKADGTFDRLEKVKAVVCGPFAIHESVCSKYPRMWNLTHIPTGFIIVRLKEYDEVAEVAEHLIQFMPVFRNKSRTKLLSELPEKVISWLQTMNQTHTYTSPPGNPTRKTKHAKSTK